MDDFETSTLWRISAFEKARDAGQLRGNDDRPTLLPTTLLVELEQLRSDPANSDVLEVIAACVRNREAALLYLEYGSHVWPVTLFPREFLYHSPRDVSDMGTGAAMSGLRLISAEPPGVKPPGDAMHERVAGRDRYHPLGALLWAVALHGPRAALLTEISGRVAYRLASSGAKDRPPSLGALSSAVARLQNEAASLRDVARWPGLSLERASRLLNALYLTGELMVSRTHPAARAQPLNWPNWLGRRR
ncbi:MAG: hypothetical protein ACXWCV_13145 [Caldimonas sp.]